ncbi:MAG: hypothetical protein FWD03_07870 [Defluviitaleaceae bacterium]|nr:hypothetical protein [Defluviitaleaceae bacterium]
MRKFSFILMLSLFFCQPVHAAENNILEATRQATFSNNPVQLSGSGVITEDNVQNPYQITAQIHGTEETRLRLSVDNETISLILTNGNIYDDQMAEQKVSSLFAKMVSTGTLDTFFLLEILTGDRPEIYSPYITHGMDNTLQLSLSPSESSVLYEHWTSDFRSLLGPAADSMSDKELSTAEGFVRQIFSALEANVQYTFHTNPDTGAITQIDIQSQTAAPQVRAVHAIIHVGDTALGVPQL